jgi:hypothetical protein
MTQLTKSTPRSSRRRPTRSRAPSRRRLRARQQPQGRLAGLAKFATGLLSQDKRGGSKKGPVALTLGAGAAGFAVVGRRRSAAGNEPTGEALAGAERPKGEAPPAGNGTREHESKAAPK